MKIKLHRGRLNRCSDYGESRSIHWTKALPFVVNPRGKLVHRVRSGCSYRNDQKWSHDAVTFWCGNSCFVAFDALTDDPPRDRLLCAVCEARAIAAGEPTAEQLAGRHVCTGQLKVSRLCCRNEGN